MIRTLRKGMRTARDIPMLFLLAGLLTMFLALSAFPDTARAATIAPVTGEIERLTVNNDNGIYSSGVIVVGGQEIILPKNLLIDLPANRLTLRQIFDQAPAACIALGESGLAKADRCNAMGTGGNATISANRTNAGNVIAGDAFLQKGIEAVTGTVTFINYAEGYYRLNGLPNDPSTGVMVRLNDPTSRHTVQSGAGCAGGPNCSPDPRFTLDPDNYTNTFTTGYPMCIPSTQTRQFPGLPAIPGVLAIAAGPTQAAADGSGDLLCPTTNRHPEQILEQAVADSRRFAPVVLGDWVTAEGNFETISGTKFLSAHTTTVGKALSTQNSTGQPDYLFLEEVFIEAPAFQNQRARAMWIGFTTLAPTDVDIWSIHRDPVNNDIHEFPLASVQGCENSAGAGTCAGLGLVNAGANIFRIRYDVDFLMAADPATPGGTKDAKLSPCQHLRASRFLTSNPGICPGVGTATEFASNMGVMSPIPHEIIARTGRKIDSPAGSLVTIDVNGATATNGEYLFPLGLNLGGIEVAEMNEIDLNAFPTPLTFEGIPWNLDRRLSPGGCLDNGGNPVACPAGALGTYVLDPFPYSGLDPRTQADFAAGGIQGGLPTGAYNDPVFNNSANPLSNVRNRIFTYVTDVGGGVFKANGNNTVLPYVLGSFPADPALIPINPTPVLNIFPPIADEDAATGTIGVPGVINVLANDIAVFGTIDPASVAIATPPATGTAVANPDGTITFTPAGAGVEIFTYTVANNFGSVSLPGTVTVTTVATFTITSAAAPNGTISPVGATTVTSGTSQTYTITPDAGFTVANLAVDGVVLPGATSYTFTNVLADHAINAYFTNQTYTITASAGANGTVTPDGVTTVNTGAASTFTFAPNPGFNIASLVVDGITLPAAASYTFTSITGNHTISANFGSNFTITAAAGPNGAISPAGASTVIGGTSQTYTIIPNAGFTVAALVVDGTTLPGATSYTFTGVAGDHYINAYFEGVVVPASVTITAGAGPNGTITPAGATTVPGGANQTFTIAGSPGFFVSALVVDGTTLPGATSYTFTNAVTDHYINAYFEAFPASVTITAAAAPGGTITPAGANVVTGGTDQTFTITPDPGLTVAALVVDGVVLPGATTYTFTGVSADHYINAYFQ